jgi:3',5'-cyclic AMP phosphodiesterase CpdA
MPGEHDASLDKGEATQSSLAPPTIPSTTRGPLHCSRQRLRSGREAGRRQLAWLAADLNQRKTDDRIVVLTHRPLFDLYPQWDWTTADGAKAIDLLMPYKNVVVFYGHIHQENHHMTGHIAHHAAKSLMFALPAPGSQPKRLPLPYDAAMPGRLGTRDVTVATTVTFEELPVTKAES